MQNWHTLCWTGRPWCQTPAIIIHPKNLLHTCATLGWVHQQNKHIGWSRDTCTISAVRAKVSFFLPSLCPFINKIKDKDFWLGSKSKSMIHKWMFYRVTSQPGNQPLQLKAWGGGVSYLAPLPLCQKALSVSAVFSVCTRGWKLSLLPLALVLSVTLINFGPRGTCLDLMVCILTGREQEN